MGPSKEEKRSGVQEDFVVDSLFGGGYTFLQVIHGANHLNGESDPVLQPNSRFIFDAENEHRALQREAESVVMDEEDSLRAEYEERYHILYQSFAKSFELLIAYMDNQSDPRMLRMSPRAMALCWRFHVAAGGHGCADIARACGIKDKQTAHKCIELFLKQQPKLPPLPGQRREHGRSNMARARNDQVRNGSHR